MPFSSFENNTAKTGSVVNHLKYQQGVRSTTYDFFDKSIYFLYRAMFWAKTSADLQAVC